MFVFVVVIHKQNIVVEPQSCADGGDPDDAMVDLSV